MSAFRVRISSPVMSGSPSRPLLDIGQEITSLRWSWDQSGPAAAQVSVVPRDNAPAVGPLIDPINIPLRGHVEITKGDSPVWEGFIRSRDRVPGGDVAAFSATGYAQSLNDRWWTRSDDVVIGGRSSGEVLGIALRNLTPWMSPGVLGDQWIDPLITYTGGMDDVTKLTVGQIADQVAQAGYQQGYPAWVLCMPGLSVWLIPRIAPREPEYRIAFDHRVRRWSESDTGMAATLTVERGTAGSGTLGSSAANPAFAGQYGFAPDLILPVGNVTEEQANAIRNAELEKRSRPTVTATLAVSADQRTWLTNRHGQPVPYWIPRISEWVGVAGEPPLPIVGVNVDGLSGEATYELGERDMSLPGRLTLVARDTASRYRQMIAATGGRLR